MDRRNFLGKAGVLATAGVATTLSSSTFANTATNVTQFNTVDDMTADTSLALGQQVQTLGYYSVNDGGGGVYTIVSTVADRVDDGEFFDLAVSGLQAQLNHEGMINVLQFGAKGDDQSDDSTAVLNALQAKDVTIRFPALNFRIGEVDVNYTAIKNQHIRIVADEGATLLPFGTTYYPYLIRFDNCISAEIQGLTFDGEGAGQYGRVNQAVYFRGLALSGSWLLISQCTFKRIHYNAADTAGLYVGGHCRDAVIRDCVFEDITNPGSNHEQFGYTYPAAGLFFSPASAREPYVTDSVVVENCRFLNIGDATDHDALRVTGGLKLLDEQGNPTDEVDESPRHLNVVVKGCIFKNNAFRSVKTQARNTYVLGNTFDNNRVYKRISGTVMDGPEVDVQRGNATVVGNVFTYSTAYHTPSILIAARSWQIKESLSGFLLMASPPTISALLRIRLLSKMAICWALSPLMPTWASRSVAVISRAM